MVQPRPPIHLNELFCAVGIEVGDFTYDVSLQNAPEHNHCVNAIAGLSAIIGAAIQEILIEKNGKPLSAGEQATQAAHYLFGNAKKELTQSSKSSVLADLFSVFETRGVAPRTSLLVSDLPTDQELTSTPRGQLPSRLLLKYRPTLSPLDIAYNLRHDVESKAVLLLQKVDEGKVFVPRKPSRQRACINICLEGIVHLAKKASYKNSVPMRTAQELACTMIYGATRIPPFVPEEYRYLQIHENGPVQ